MSLAYLWVFFGILLIVALVMAVYPLKKGARGLKCGIMLFICAAATLGYWHWGAWRELANYASSQRADVLMKSLKNPQAVVEKLQQHLAHHPDSAKGWFLLGRLYASQNEWTHASEAFERAYQLNPENVQIEVNVAQSRWQLHHQQFSPGIRELFQSILKKNPHQPDALSMLAIDAFQQKDYSKAITYWSTLLDLLPSDSSEAKVIRKAISKAQTRRRHGVDNAPGPSS